MKYAQRPSMAVEHGSSRLNGNLKIQNQTINHPALAVENLELSITNVEFTRVGRHGMALVNPSVTDVRRGDHLLCVLPAILNNL
jgi:hypothetical protein